MSTDIIGKGIQIAGTIASFANPIAWYIRAGIVIGTSLLGGYLRSRGSDAAERERGTSVNVASNEAAVPVVYGRRFGR